MESTIWKQAEAAGERKMVALQLEVRLEAEASRFANRLSRCTEPQLEAMGRLLVGDPSREELIASLERVLSGA